VVCVMNWQGAKNLLPWAVATNSVSPEKQLIEFAGGV